MSLKCFAFMRWGSTARKIGARIITLHYSVFVFRFYAVGEYGEENRRPHYHAALFGFPPCWRGRTFVNRVNNVCCPVCTLVAKSWEYGYSYVGQLQPESAAYIAGYVTKKFLQVPDTMGLRAPFARMSNRPGIGAGAMDDLASTLLMAEYDQTDVPTSLLQGNKSFPLGRYLRRRLRKRIGREEATPEEAMAEIDQQVSELRETAFKNSRSFKEVLVEAGEGHRAKQSFWQRIRDQRKRSSGL